MSARTAQERAAHARWAARRRKQIYLGQWQPFVAAEPVRAHLRKVQATGMPLRVVSEQTGLSLTALRYVLWGDVEHGPGEKCRRETAEAVLSYWPAIADFPDHARIDPTGTKRRVEALEMLGFGRMAMADKVGMPKASFSRALRADRITAQVARAVMDLYDGWWNQTPEAHGVLPWVADRTRRSAKARGFAGPLAWDDNTIDDPAAVPQTDASPSDYTDGDGAEDDYVDRVAVQRFVAGAQVDVTDAEWLVALKECMARGMSCGQVDELRRAPKGTTEKSVNRLRKAYLRAGRELPEALRPTKVGTFADQQVVEIRERYAAGGTTDLELAMRYQVSRETITSLLSGDTYRAAGGPIRKKRSGRPTETSRVEFNLHTGFGSRADVAQAS